MNTEEAWDAIKLTAGYEHGWEDAVRAYGAARELKGHVAACAATNSEKALCGTAWRGMVWYCDKGKEIEALR